MSLLIPGVQIAWTDGINDDAVGSLGGDFDRNVVVNVPFECYYGSPPQDSLQKLETGLVKSKQLAIQ